MRHLKACAAFVAAVFIFATAAEAGEAVGVEIRFENGLAQIPVSSDKSGLAFWESGPSKPAAGRFDSLTFQGQSDGPAVDLFVSLQSGGGWSRWTRAYVKWYPNGRFWGSFPVSGESGASVRLRIAGRDAGTGNVNIFELQAVNRAAGSDGFKTAPGLRVDVPASALVAPAPPVIVSRDDWKAAPAKKPYEPMQPLLITVHHTEGLQAMTKESAIRELRIIQDYHMSPDGLDFVDIGYHFLIDGAGNIYQGRPETMVGAHVSRQNEGNIGISLMGNFQPPSTRKPTEKQLAATVDLLRWLTGNYGIPVKAVLAHRDQNATSCPGDALYALMDNIRKLTAEEQRLSPRGETLKTLDISDPSAVFDILEGGR